MPCTQCASACPGAIDNAIATASRPRSDAAAAAGGVTPPRITDQVLTGERQTRQCLDIARVACERSEVAALRLGRQLGAHSFGERVRRP